MAVLVPVLVLVLLVDDLMPGFNREEMFNIVWW